MARGFQAADPPRTLPDPDARREMIAARRDEIAR